MAKLAAGDAAPAFTLPPLEGSGLAGFGDGDLRGGKVTLVNVFASWCGPCRDEHPVLLELSKNPELARAGVRWTVSTLHPARPAARTATARLWARKGLVTDAARRKIWVIESTLFP